MKFTLRFSWRYAWSGEMLRSEFWLEKHLIGRSKGPIIEQVDKAASLLAELLNMIDSYL